MERPFIEQLRIQNYGCIRDATFQLTPLHALIGPNDSGKSTVLRALQTLSFLMIQNPDTKHSAAMLRAIMASSDKIGPRFHASTSITTWRIEFSPGGRYRWFSVERGGNEPSDWSERRDYDQSFGSPSLPGSSPAKDIVKALRGAQMLRLEPDALRQPHALIPDDQPLRFLDERGTGLSAVYDALTARNLQAFININNELSHRFPSVKSIQLTTPNTNTRGLGVRLVDGTFVPAEFMSEGLLYYLAFAAIPHLEPTAILLVEEPENGLHPARIAEIMQGLRDLSSSTQIVIATHSPLVINELKPDEVTVITRTAEGGTTATVIKDTPNFEERSKVYALGELWLSYANGKDEGPLLLGGSRPWRGGHSDA
jgi:energy-coupling factor transporter ATP-binding protein EcfA2